jgi:hypothetical protein
MQNTLRSLVLASAVLAASAFTATAARAATAVNVPFAFSIGDKICPAGHYILRKDDLGGSVELVGDAQGFKWVLHPGDPAPTDNRVILKFAEVGSQHVLQSVQFGPMTTSRLDKKVRESETAQTVKVTVEGQ